MNHKIISKITAGMLLSSVLLYTLPVHAYTKEETVYSKLNTTGDNYQTIVNSHIQNDTHLKQINDLSDLLNIKNVHGNETFHQDGKTLVWNTNGDDIYYQGETKKDLPIECKISYTLNGKQISAKELAGKSGKVKITIEYLNKDEHIVNINGNKEKMYTPFTVICGTVIDNENHKNIKITNGKTIDNGNKTAIIGIAFPGLQESLGIEKKTFDIPNTIEISMEATDFELSNILTFVSPKLIEDTNLDSLDDINKLYNQIDTLQNASNQLVSGANTLKEGTNTYTKKSKEFNSAMKQIANGTSTINTNYTKIDNGINTLSAGSSNLQNGMETLNSGIHELSSSLNTLPNNINALYQGSTFLNKGITDANGNNIILSGVTTLEESLTQTITASLSALQSNNTTLSNQIAGLKDEQTTLQNQISTLTQVKNSLENEDTQTTLQNTIDELTTQKSNIVKKITALSVQKETNKAIIAKLTPSQESKAQIEALNKGIQQIGNGIKQLNDNLGKLNDAASSLPDSLSKLSSGSSTLLTGSKQISSGANSLTQGSSALKVGIQSLNTNTQKLAKANNQLTDGATTINEGTATLSEGISQFHKEGIQSICKYVNGDVKDLTARLEKLQELSEAYNNFTQLENGNTGTVKFIMIMDSIKKEDNQKQEVIIEDNRNDNKEE